MSSCLGYAMWETDIRRIADRQTAGTDREMVLRRQSWSRRRRLWRRARRAPSRARRESSPPRARLVHRRGRTSVRRPPAFRRSTSPTALQRRPSVKWKQRTLRERQRRQPQSLSHEAIDGCLPVPAKGWLRHRIAKGAELNTPAVSSAARSRRSARAARSAAARGRASRAARPARAEHRRAGPRRRARCIQLAGYAIDEIVRLFAKRSSDTRVGQLQKRPLEMRGQ